MKWLILVMLMEVSWECGESGRLSGRNPMKKPRTFHNNGK
jgi:hypothetical protein